MAAFDHLLEKVVNDPNYSAAAAAVAILIVLLTFVLLKFIASPVSRGAKVLLIGLSEAGKTTMLTKLLNAGPVQTLTSMDKNEAVVKIGGRSVSLVDLPGFDRLRDRFFDDCKSSAKAVVFVLDSLSFVSNSRHVADFLYTVLSDPIIMKKRTPILIACNKQDETKAKSAKVLQKQLEKELHAIRETRSAGLSSTERDSDFVFLGRQEKELQWTDCKNRIEFVDCSCCPEEKLEEVRNFLSTV